MNGVRSEKLLWTGSAIGMVFVATCLFGTIKILEYLKLEKVIPYTISAPSPPRDGTVLEKPTIKVGNIQEVQAGMLMTNRLQVQQRFNVTLQQLANSSASSTPSPPKVSTARSRRPKLRSKNGNERRFRSADKSFDAYKRL